MEVCDKSENPDDMYTGVYNEKKLKKEKSFQSKHSDNVEKTVIEKIPSLRENTIIRQKPSLCYEKPAPSPPLELVGDSTFRLVGNGN
jgi:hypothetical protein